MRASDSLASDTATRALRTALVSGIGHIREMEADGTLPSVELLVAAGEPGSDLTRTVARVLGRQIPVVYSDAVESSVNAAAATGAAPVVERLVVSTLPLLFCDREPLRLVEGTNQKVGRIASMARACFALLTQHRIEQVLTCSTPHRLSTYVLGRVAELMGIPLYIVDRSPLPHRYWTMRGFDREPVVDANVTLPPVPSERTLKYLAQQRDAQDFEPSYMRAQRQHYKQRLYSTAGELRSLARGPWRIWDPLQIWRKRQLFYRYQELCQRAEPPTAQRIVYFLHYQPERTTLPEAGLYVSQELAVLALADAVPATWTICVREHPSTWMLRYSRGGRTRECYENLAQHPRVRFVSSEEPVNSLIDGSLAVATSTGNVGFQALCRGVPALAFGSATYAGHPWCYRIRSAEDVTAAVKALQDGGWTRRADAATVSENFAREVEAISTEEPPGDPEQAPRAVRLAALTRQLCAFLASQQRLETSEARLLPTS